jgi:hypothetical protein
MSTTRTWSSWLHPTILNASHIPLVGYDQSVSKRIWYDIKYIINQSREAHILSVTSVSAVSFQSLSFYKLFLSYAGHLSAIGRHTHFMNYHIVSWYEPTYKLPVIIILHYILCLQWTMTTRTYLTQNFRRRMYKCTTFDTLHNAIIYATQRHS